MKRSDTTPGAGNAGAFEANTSGRASWLSTEHLPPALSELQATRPGKECRAGPVIWRGPQVTQGRQRSRHCWPKAVALCLQRPGLEGPEMEEEV